MAGFEGGSEDIEDEEGKVPGEDENVDEEAGDFVEDAHVHLVGNLVEWRGLAVDEAVERLRFAAITMKSIRGMHRPNMANSIAEHD
jgi:hypothetical protein